MDYAFSSLFNCLYLIVCILMPILAIAGVVYFFLRKDPNTKDLQTGDNSEATDLIYGFSAAALKKWLQSQNEKGLHTTAELLADIDRKMAIHEREDQGQKNHEASLKKVDADSTTDTKKQPIADLAPFHNNETVKRE